MSRPAPRWRAPRLWPGEVVVVMATGSSLTQAQVDYVHSKCARAIAVNDAYRLAPWAPVLYAADMSWWDVHTPQLSAFTGLRVGAQLDIKDPRINVLVNDCDGAYSKFEDNGFTRGSNSGAEAMHLAYHFTGGPKIILLGCDCVGKHFFGDHPPRLNRSGDMRSFAQSFEAVGKQLLQRGVDVVNCSPISALTCFRKSKLEEEL